MSDNSLPSRRPGSELSPFAGHFSHQRYGPRYAWSGAAPEIMQDAALYEAVVVRRVLAYLVDLVVIAAIGLVVGTALGIVSALTFGLLSPLVAVGGLVPLTYHTLTIGGPRHATVGQLVMRLEVRRWDGGQPGYIQALVQTALFYLTLAVPPLWIGLAWPLINSRSRCLHDILSGTVIVNSDRVAVI